MKRLGHCVLAGVLWFTVSWDVRAQTTNSWTSSVSNKWEGGVNWSLPVPPSTNGQSAILVTNASAKTVTIDATTVLSNGLNACMTISNLLVSGPSGTINTLQLTNAGAVTALRILNATTISSGGALLVTNSTLLINGPTAGACFIDGTADLRADGSIFLTNGVTTFPSMIIGNVATGAFTMAGGLIRTEGGMIVGNLGGSRGTFTMSGGTVVFPASDLVIGSSLNSTGSVSVVGGTLLGGSGHGLTVGNSGVGDIIVSNTGSVDVWNVKVGSQFNCRAGTLTVATGGRFSAEQNFQVGGSSGSTGTVWLTGGTLETLASSSSPSDRQIIGDGSVGSMTISNGTFIAHGSELVVGFTGQGTLTVVGGTNTIEHFFTLGEAGFSKGTVLVSGGLLTITNTALGSTTAIAFAGNGALTVSGGRVLARDVQVAATFGGHGTLTVQDSGTMAIVGPLKVGNSAVTTGTVWITGGQLVVTNTPGTVGAGSGFIIDGSVVVTNGSSIVVSNVDTIVGNRGSGSLTNFGGSTLFNNLTVGNLAGSRGTVTFAGGTNRTLASTVIASFPASTGTVWITGGFVNPAFGFVFSVGANGSGQLILSNGTLRSDLMTVGDTGGGVGTLTVAGGIWDGPGALSVGAAFNSFGTVWITGGTIVLTNTSWDNAIGNGGVGRMTVSNGLVSTRQMNLGVGAGTGTLTMAGGTNTVYSGMILGNNVCTATGIVIVVGGRLDVTNVTGTAVLDVRSGTVTFNSGTLVIDRLFVTNSCGHFIYTGAPPAIGTKTLGAGMDADGDGLPNDWEQANGLDPLDPNGANGPNGDPDGDGQSNLAEYLAGTMPTVDIKSIVRTNNDIRVTWQAAASKTNALQRSPGSNGSFSNNFADIFIVTNNVGSVTNYLDNGAATNFPASYYRIRLVP